MSGTTGLFGVTIKDYTYIPGATSYSSAWDIWNGWLGTPAGATKIFNNPSVFPTTPTAKCQAAISHGARIYLCYQPSASLSSSDRTNLLASINAMAAACTSAGTGASIAGVILYQEVNNFNNSGIPATGTGGYIPIVNYYGPNIRSAGYKLGFCGGSGSAQNWKTYFQNAAQTCPFDFGVVDYYASAYNGGTRLDSGTNGGGTGNNMTAICTALGIPFGIMEMGTSAQANATGPANSVVIAYIQYCQQVMTNWVAAGNNAMDCAWYEGTSINLISSSSDYRIPYLKAFIAATTTTASGAFAEVQGSANIAATSGVLGLWFSQGGGTGSTAGNLLVARIVTNDGAQTITGPAGWVLDSRADKASGTGSSGVARAQIWYYPSNPGGLGRSQSYTATSASPCVFTVTGSAPANATPVILSGSVPGNFTAGTVYYVVSSSGSTFQLAATTGGAAINSTSAVTSGGVLAFPQVFTGSNTGSSIKGNLCEYSTTAGYGEFTDQIGSGAAGVASTTMPVTCSAPAHPGGLGVVLFAANYSSVPSTSWTVPSGWTSDGNINNVVLDYSSYFKTGLASGAVSVTGTISTSVNMNGYAAVLVTFYSVASSLNITTATLPSAATGTAYSQSLAATGGSPPYTWALTGSLPLPAGLSLSSAGALSGTPTTPGTYSFTVQVTDSVGATATAVLSLTVTGTPAVTSASLIGDVGLAFSQQLAATGGTAPYTFTVVPGGTAYGSGTYGSGPYATSNAGLPPGLSMSSGGLITGTPTSAGSYVFNVQVTDSLAATGISTISVNIAPALAVVPGLPDGQIGGPYPFQMTTSGGQPSFAWAITAGSLPPGLTANPDGSFDGTTSTAGVFNFTAQVTDALGATASGAMTVTVGQPFTPVPVPSGGGVSMADSLVLAGQIELLGGGVPSANPDCFGAMFRLVPGYDLSAPVITAEMAAGLLLDGEMITGTRASNRTLRLPVAIVVPSTGNQVADRATLAGGRELLLRLASEEHWTLTWAREGGYPLVFDCMAISSTTITYSTKLDRELASIVEIQCSAMPYGRSEDPEQIQVNTPSQVWDQPPAPVVLDNFTVSENYLTGDSSTFETSTADWTAAGNCTIARSTAQAHSGVASLALTSSAAGNMQAASNLASNYALMIPVRPGDTITISAFSRAATVIRSVNVAAEYFDALGNNLGVPARGSNVTNSTTAFTASPSFSGTAPASAASARVNFQVVGTAAAGEVHYLDDVSINRGPVFSNVDPLEWTASTVTPLTGQQSAYWSRNPSDHPVYDRTLPGQLDITGRVKFSFWAGFASTASMYHVWHKGTVHYSITLTDNLGATLSFGVKMLGQVSALSTIPHWQHISAPIPQVSGFNYTNIVAYHIEAWNTYDHASQQPVLQASFYLAGVQAQATSAGSAAARAAWLSLPGIKGTARAPLALQIAPGTSSFSSVAVFTTVGSNNWTAPAGLTKIDKVECWGAGGGGAASTTAAGGNGGGGGGGGEYSQNINVPVTAGNTYHPVVGAGGQNGTVASSPSNDASAGGNSYFVGDSGKQTNANGGQQGFISGFNGGGAAGSGSNDYLHHPGGDGFRANFQWNGTGGGGGSSGGPGSAGTDSGGQKGATAVTNGGAGGDGGSRRPQDFNSGRPGTAPGGGGGGGALVTDGTIRGGGQGANGQVKLSYGATGIFPLASFLVHMPQVNAPAALNPVCSVGNGADTPDGREYTLPAISNLNARFDGTYTIYLIASAWNTPGSSRTVTVQVRQYPYSGGTAFVAPALTRTITPNTDIVNGYCDMGALTLPLADLPPGNTDWYTTVGVTSSNTADRFYDVLFIDSQGQLILVNMPGTAWCNLAWIDEADRDRDLGRVSGSDTDLNRARSLLQWTDRLSGGPLSVTPDQDNRLLLYATQGVPAATAFYAPRWWTERLS